MGIFGGGASSVMCAIIGLGNPGDEYRHTRHNVGFECVDKLAYDHGINMKRERKFRADIGTGSIAGRKVLLAKPNTYMNLSGEAVREVLNFYKLSHAHLIIIYDDYALPVGEVRCRPQGGSNGQKGMSNIISALGTQEICRIRIGIGSKPPQWSLSDYVLSRFLREEWSEMIAGITKAGDAAQAILTNGIDAAMNTFNRKTGDVIV
jgi:PTH1 family peptidyl-tRNA hydrolase